MDFIISTLSFSSLYGILVSILTICIMYWSVNKFNYIINVLIYMVSRTLLGFIITKFIAAVAMATTDAKLTLGAFLANLILGVIMAKILEFFSNDKGYSMGIFVLLGVISEAIVGFIISFILGMFA